MAVRAVSFTRSLLFQRRRPTLIESLRLRAKQSCTNASALASLALPSALPAPSTLSTLSTLSTPHHHHHHCGTECCDQVGGRGVLHVATVLNATAAAWEVQPDQPCQARAAKDLTIPHHC